MDIGNHRKLQNEEVTSIYLGYRTVLIKNNPTLEKQWQNVVSEQHMCAKASLG